MLLGACVCSHSFSLGILALFLSTNLNQAGPHIYLYLKAVESVSGLTLHLFQVLERVLAESLQKDPPPMPPHAPPTVRISTMLRASVKHPLWQ